MVFFVNLREVTNLEDDRSELLDAIEPLVNRRSAVAR